MSENYNQKQWNQATPMPAKFLLPDGTVADELPTAGGLDGNLYYTKSQVDEKFAGVSNIKMKVVDELPTTDIQKDVIYLVENGTNNYTQWIYTVDAQWYSIGNTQLNLQGFVKQEYMSEEDYQALVASGQVDPTKDYNTFEV